MIAQGPLEPKGSIRQIDHGISIEALKQQKRIKEWYSYSRNIQVYPLHRGSPLRDYLIKTWTNTDLCLWLKPSTLRSLPSPSMSGGGSPVIRSSITSVTGKRSLKIIISFRRTKAKYTLNVELLYK